MSYSLAIFGPRLTRAFFFPWRAMNVAARVGEEVRISKIADGHMGGPGGGDWSRGHIQSRVIGPVLFFLL